MSPQRRRDLLAGTVTLVALAGCLGTEWSTADRTDDAGESSPASERAGSVGSLTDAGDGLADAGDGPVEAGRADTGDDPTDADDDLADDERPRSPDDTPEDQPDVGDGIETAELVRYDHPRYPDEPSAHLLTSADDAESWLDDHDHVDEESALAVLEETDFEEAVVLVVEAGGRDLCQHLAVDELCLEVETLAASAAVRKAPDTGDLCAQQVIAVGAVVRVVVADDLPERACVTVVDQDGVDHRIVVDDGTEGDRVGEDQ